MSIPEFDGWVFARLLAGHTLNGEMGNVTEPLRSQANSLNAIAASERSAAWAVFVSSRDDRRELERLVADADPEGPPPDVVVGPDEDGTEGGWEPALFQSLPVAPPFPLDVLPIPARDLVDAASRSISCPPDFVAVAVLAAASGLIGRSAVLQLKPGYHASASLFLALVAGPSAGKSPAIRSVMRPIWRIATEIFEAWKVEKQDWDDSEQEDKGQPPELKRLVTTDPTTEALGPILAKNPRGLVVSPDEMTKWVLGMDQYKGGRGGDRPFYLSAWGGEPVTIDRAKNGREPILVPRPFLTVVGGMTPDMLSTLSEGKGREDGFVARLLFCYPGKVKRSFSEEGVPSSVAEGWDRLACALWGRDLIDDSGIPGPAVVRLSEGAAKAYAAWCREHYEEQEADGFPEGLEGPWGKLEAYVGRLALILYLLDLAADPTRDPNAPLDDLPARFMEGATRLVAYFKSQAIRVYGAMDGKAKMGGGDVQSLLGWVIRNGHSEFSVRDINRNFDRFQGDPVSLHKALRWMLNQNLIRPLAVSPSSNKGGRKPSSRYEVNPEVHDSPRFRQFRRYVAPELDSSETSESRDPSTGGGCDGA